MGGHDDIYSNCTLPVVHSQLVFLLDVADEADERWRQLVGGATLEYFEVEWTKFIRAINCDVVIVLCGDSGCTL